MTITPDLVADVKMIVTVMVVEVLEGGILVPLSSFNNKIYPWVVI